MIPINTLLAAYQQGLFPMAVNGRIGWFSPERRGILPLDRFHASRRLRRRLRHQTFASSIDRAFDDVIRACAARPNHAGNWIDEEIIESYTALHRAGYAHSVEVWDRDRLAGGLYGVSLGAAFFGESMFHTVTDGSKVALCVLVDRLRTRGYRLLDIQWLTPHLARFGAVEVPRARYLTLLREAIDVPCTFDDGPSPTSAGLGPPPGTSSGRTPP